MTERVEGCMLCDLDASPSGPEAGWVLRNNLVSAYVNSSQVPGWFQLQVNRHVVTMAELNDAEAAAIGQAARSIGAATLEVTGVERIYAYSICESIHHFHMVLGAAPEGELSGPRGAPLLSRVLTRDTSLQDPARAAEVAGDVRDLLAKTLPS